MAIAHGLDDGHRHMDRAISRHAGVLALLERQGHPVGIAIALLALSSWRWRVRQAEAAARSGSPIAEFNLRKGFFIGCSR